jgi:trimeric autotransporter adhesin
VTLTAPAGYQIRVFGTGGYVSSLTLASNNGVVPSTRIQVRFVPVADGVNNGTLVVSSPGITSTEVDLTGNGIVPVITANPTSLAFGSVFVGQTSAPINFTVSGTNVANDVTITAPTGFRVRRTSTDAYTSSVVLTAAEVTTGFTLQAAFQPATAGSYASSISVTTPGASTSVSVTGTATAAPSGAFIDVNPTALDFNTVTTSGSSQILSFTVFAGNLTAPLVLTASSANISFRDATSGGSFTTGPITINPSNGTVNTRVIEVRLIRPVGSGLFSGTIVASSTGATSRTVTINGNNASGATSDISVTNPNNTEFTFVARPNTFSNALTYEVSATNLIQDLTIRPEGSNASFFQVSLDGITFVNSLVIPRDASGNVAKRPIYIRFVPGNAATTVTALIRNSSAPADNGDLTVTGISEPTLRLSRAIGDFPDNVVRDTKSSPSTGNSPLRVIGLLLGSNVDLRVPADAGDATRNPSGFPQFEFSIDGGTTYVQQATIPIDANGSIDQNLLVRYAPTRVGAASTNLEFRNSSFASGSYFNLASGFGNTKGFAIAPVPTAQSTASIVRSGATATVSFDLTNPPTGTSYGQSRLVIVSSTYATLPVGLQPQQKQNFDPGTTSNGSYVFGTGTAIGPNGSDTYVVFSGSGSTFSVSNLDPGKTYYFYSFEFNNDGLLNAENYRVPSNQPTQPIPLPVTLVSFSAKVKNSQVALTWVTASELNNKGFEVQRSRDGQVFETVLTRDGQGTTNATTTYNEVDRKPLNGLSYYRLKQVDLDGTSSYSSLVPVNFLNSGDVTMYPNPVEDLLNINVGGSAEGMTAVITDMTGRLISTRKLGADSKLDMTGLQAGTYLVTVGEGDAKVTRRIVKK